MSVTEKEYSGFERAYNFMNQDLFNGTLPSTLITLQKKANCSGCFISNSFTNRTDKTITTDEISLNPDHFKENSDQEILAILVHEMVHLHQFHYGKPSRGGYHNKEWATQMESIGLKPSDTGKPGGKRTGQRISHYIIKGGKFEQSVGKLLSQGFKLNWEGNGIEIKNNNRSKSKFSCLNCKQNAWAKPAASLICGICNKTMKIENEN